MDGYVGTYFITNGWIQKEAEEEAEETSEWKVAIKGTNVFNISWVNGQSWHEQIFTTMNTPLSHELLTFKYWCPRLYIHPRKNNVKHYLSSFLWTVRADFLQTILFKKKNSLNQNLYNRILWNDCNNKDKRNDANKTDRGSKSRRWEGFVRLKASSDQNNYLAKLHSTISNRGSHPSIIQRDVIPGVTPGALQLRVAIVQCG